MAVDHLTAPPLKVAVIGGGVAGLAAARALKSEGHEVVIYEKSEKLGGTWVYDPRVESDPLSLDPNREIVHSSLYHSLRTNLPRQLMGFSDYPFSTQENGDPRTFPGHGEVLQFLNEFAAKFELGELVRFNTEVVRVERLDMRNDEWVIESRSNGASFTLNELFTAVVVCVGHNTIPRVANFPGREKWPGKEIHSHNYRIHDPFEDKMVVVIGNGPSAIDISVEIAEVAKQVHVSSRSANVEVSNLDCRDNMWQHSKDRPCTWVYDPRVESDPLSLDPNREIVHSSLYHSLRTNLPRQLMGFSDYPFSTQENGDPRTFPGHGEVLQFLNEFAAKFELGELVRFNTEVVRVERLDMRNDEWVIESRSNGASFTLNELFTAVVVCVGHNTIPRVADFPGREKWPGKEIHSHNYRIPDPFEDKMVVVIGNGPSAIDISVEIAEVAKQVHVSSRSADVEVSNLDCRDNMWQHSKIDHANENGEVVFEDGAVVHADIILHCTGYMFDFPFLKTDGIVSVEDGRVGPLYNHIFPPKLAPNLSFIGLPYMTIVIEMIDLQAKWVARILSGKACLPSTVEMEAEVQRHYLRMEEKGIPKKHTHSLHFKLDYLDWLANEVGMGRVDETRRSLMGRYLKFIIEVGKWRNKDWEP